MIQQYQIIHDAVAAQDEVEKVELAPDTDTLIISFTDGAIAHAKLVLPVGPALDLEPEPEPVDVRALILWETVNCWYSDVSFTSRQVAHKMVQVNRPLTNAELFDVAAQYKDQVEAGLRSVPMDGYWNAVELGHESLLILNGDMPDRFADTFHDLEREGHGPVGTYEETARLMLFATGPIPARRYNFTSSV